MSRRNAYCKLIFLCWAVVSLVWVAPARAQDAQDEFNMASGFYSRGEWDASIDAFESVISLFPGTQQAFTSYFFVGEAMTQQGDFAGAYQAFRDFLTKMPRHQYSPRATFRLGESAYRLQNIDQAIRILEIFVQDNPADPLNEFALPYLGEMRIKRDEPQLAQKAYETALRAFPDSPLRDKCRLGLAKVYQLQQATEQASQLYQSLIAESDESLAGEARLQMGILSFGRGDFDSARMYLNDTLARNSVTAARAEATYWLARIEVAANRFENAIKLFRDAVDQSKNEILTEAIFFDGSLAAIQADDSRLAEHWLGELCRRWPEGQRADEAMQLRIEIAQRETRFDEALALIKQFREVYTKSPHRFKVLESEGRIYYRQHEYQQSFDTFELLLETTSGPQRETWKYLQALCLIRMDRSAEAEFVLESIDLNGQSQDVRALVELARASTYFERENYESSLASYQIYLALAPAGVESLRARAELAIAFARLKQWANASEAFAVLKGQDPGNTLTLETARHLAETAFAANEYVYAHEWFDYLTGPENPNQLIACGLSGLGWIKIREDDSDAADKIFDVLLADHSDSRFAIDAALARAESCMDSRQFGSASRWYIYAIEKLQDPKIKLEATLRCAYALQQSGDPSDLRTAKSLLEEFVASSADKETSDEVVYQLGWIYHDLELESEWIEQFELLVQDYPDSKYWSDAAFRLVQIHVRKKELDNAQKLIQRLMMPKTPVDILSRVVFLNGQISAQKDDWEPLTHSMRKLAPAIEDEKLYSTCTYWLAESLYRRDQFSEAGELFSSLIEQTNQLDDSLAPWVFLRAGQCEAKLEHWIEAKSLAKTASKSYPDFKARHEYDFIVGQALAAKGKYNNAIVAFQRVVNSNKGGSTETAAIAQWRIGESYFHQEKYEKAIRAYYRVDSIYGYKKWRAAALMQAGKCQEHLGNWPQAAKLYQQILDNFPECEFREAAEQRMLFSTRQAKIEVSATKRKTH